MEFEPMFTPREKSPLPKMSPEEDRTHDAVDSEPKHYQLSYSGPLTHSQYAYTGWTSLHYDPKMPGVLHGHHYSTNFKSEGMPELRNDCHFPHLTWTMP